MRPILLIGGGGHCRSCIDVIEAEKRFQIAGIVQPVAEGVTPVLGYPILGVDEDLPDLLEHCSNALVAVGQIKTSAVRVRLFELLAKLGADLPIVVSPSAYVSRHATLGAGTIVMHGAIVNAGVHVGANGIVNSQALIEHDSEVGPHCHIATGARIGGGATVGTGCFIGSGAIVREGVSIGPNAVIGAGCLILHDVRGDTVVRAQ